MECSYNGAFFIFVEIYFNIFGVFSLISADKVSFTSAINISVQK